MSSVILYGKVDCPLCDQAYDLLSPLDITIKMIDIRTDPTLMARYGSQIPVLEFDDGTSLNWPFDSADINKMIAR